MLPIPFHTPTFAAAKAHPPFTQVTITASAFPSPTDAQGPPGLQAKPAKQKIKRVGWLASQLARPRPRWRGTEVKWDSTVFGGETAPPPPKEPRKRDKPPPKVR